MLFDDDNILSVNIKETHTSSDSIRYVKQNLYNPYAILGDF